MLHVSGEGHGWVGEVGRKEWLGVAVGEGISSFVLAHIRKDISG